MTVAVSPGLKDNKQDQAMLWGHQPWALHRLCRWEFHHVRVDWSCLSPWQRHCEVGIVRGGDWSFWVPLSLLKRKVTRSRENLSFPTCQSELFPWPWGSWVQLCVVHWARDAHYSSGRYRRHGLKFQLKCEEAFFLCSFYSLYVCPHRRERFSSTVSYIRCPLAFSQWGTLPLFVVVLLSLKFLSPDSENSTIVQEMDMTQNPRVMAIRACLTLGRHCPKHYVPLLHWIFTTPKWYKALSLH